MPREPKPLSEQSRRFIEMAEKIGAEASEEEFERYARRRIMPPSHPSPMVAPATARSVKRVKKAKQSRSGAKS
jgi:hypothetical protein